MAYGLLGGLRATTTGGRFWTIWATSGGDLGRCGRAVMIVGSLEVMPDRWGLPGRDEGGRTIRTWEAEGGNFGREYSGNMFRTEVAGIIEN